MSGVPFVQPQALDSNSARRRLLLVFDGGNAPGYSSVAVALTEEGSRRGYEVWAAAEGFRSLTSYTKAPLRFERLVVDREERYRLLAQGIPTRSMGRRVLDPGSDFRSERFLEFFRREVRDEAAKAFHAHGFTHLICIGGNGTLDGLRAWLESFDTQESGPRPQCGFINVSVDNDVSGDRAIGFLSGVEAGATVARGLYEDAYTHKRIYILEMMGNRSGRHALHCGVAARAHLVILPFFRFPEEVLEEIAHALDHASHALVVVAEGYEKERRDNDYGGLNAAAFFRLQLESFGLRDRPDRRLIAEPFSRHVRGVRPLFADVAAAYLKSSLLFDAFERGESEIMPYVLASHDVGVRPIASLRREDRVERAFLPLIDRLNLPRFRAWVQAHFTSEGSSLG
ncbi:MAG: 6-phosphofructokinase [Sandaracinaceae bacterium]|nr:6-phosphofructokinase [Sandaracinaceae bacterium]